MADDLAARISDGAVAVLDLVPGEQRFHDLSRFVLRGGASRFAAAVLDDEPLRYVLPVGVPGRKLDYGTLLIQRSRCALVWRTDPARPYHAKIAALGPDTTVSQSPVTIRGEVWGRFDLHPADGPTMTFLVPPVAATALPRMLHRVLVDEPRSRLAFVEAPPLPTAVTDGVAEPVPSAADPDAPTEDLGPALRADEPDPDAAAHEPPAVAAQPGAAEPRPEARARTEQDRSAADEFGLSEAPAGAATEPAVTAEPAEEETFEDLYRTTERVTPAESAPTLTAQPPAPTRPPVTAVYRPVRPEPLATPVPPPDPASAAGSAVRAAAPAPVTAAPLPGGTPAGPTPGTGASADAPERPRLPDGLSGYLTGLVVTLVIGGLFLLAKVLGWLG